MIATRHQKKRPHLPNPARLIHALSQIGYRFEDAVSDLIDNSITAGASEVVIRFFHDGQELKSIAIADNGCGMTEKKLIASMKFGSDEDISTHTLGKFGLGMKLASLSRCSELSVYSKRNGKITSQQWTEEGIAAGWLLTAVDKAVAKELFNIPWAGLEKKHSGTIVHWENLRNLPTHKKGVRSALGWVERRLRIHLGLTFHRFIESGKIRIRLDQQHINESIRSHNVTIKALNPFGYKKSGDKEYPSILHTPVIEGIGSLQLECHIWPPLSKSEEYRLGKKASSHQGFYIYRNQRLIQAGGWLGLVADDSEPHNSLARIKLDLPASGDNLFQLNVQKTNVITPIGFDEAVAAAKARSGMTFSEFRKKAVEVYRHSNIPERQPFEAGKGIPKHRNQIRHGARELDLKVKSNDQPIQLDIARSELVIDRELDTLLRSDPYLSNRVLRLILFEISRNEGKNAKISSQLSNILNSVNAYLLEKHY